MKRSILPFLCLTLLTVTGPRAEEPAAAEGETAASPPPVEQQEETPTEEVAPVEEQATATTEEQAPTTAEEPAAEQAAPVEGSPDPAAEATPPAETVPPVTAAPTTPVAEKQIDITVKQAPEPTKKEEAPPEKEVVRPYFGVAIASGVFGVLALASGFYFDYLAKKSFDKYKTMATAEAITEATKKPDFDPNDYVRKTRAKYDEGREHLNSRNYSFIGGAIFLAAGVGLYFWTEEKKPEEEKKDETVSDKKVSVHSVGDRVTINFSGSF